ncbi:hypothetical protein SAMN04487907_1152 [Zunongwangia mangrovi]|uniref:Uncharacterized protein n=1 Tax=Zunongwangia mangrovi TaxID=1334022 RepID=A0A1I1N4K5_9FLAO|nr:hypothetical protein [Zunongwangia mangrovi]SFC92549.1 hypothetical protein SAMN04487907_1152 [Zunongwangia mangrovi]
MRNTIFLVLILVILSCQNEKSEKTQNVELNTETEIIQPEKLVFNDTVIYLSENNDLALIKLTLIPNQTFDLYMKIYPEPMQDVETGSEIINSNGTWSGNGQTVSLNFTEIKKDALNLNALFDLNYKEGNEFTVINKNKVEIDYSLDKINIWGINCYKSEK